MYNGQNSTSLSLRCSSLFVFSRGPCTTFIFLCLSPWLNLFHMLSPILIREATGMRLQGQWARQDIQAGFVLQPSLCAGLPFKSCSFSSSQPSRNIWGLLTFETDIPVLGCTWPRSPKVISDGQVGGSHAVVK